jgi:hypothetical protein
VHALLRLRLQVWSTVALNQRLARLQEELDDRVNKGLPAHRCSSDAYKRCTRLKARYRCMRDSMNGGGDAGCDCTEAAEDGADGDP